MKTILVPIDFSPVTKRVMTNAAALTQGFGGRMILLNVTQPRSMLTDHAALLKTVADFERYEATSGRPAKRRAQDDNAHPALPGDSLQLVGEPVSIILQQASELNADYIVLGSHGHSRLHDLFLGSTAAGVLKGAKCPVVMVPARKKRLRARFDRIVGRHLPAKKKPRRTKIGRRHKIASRKPIAPVA